MECWEDKFISLFDYSIGKAAALDKIAISPVAIPSETIEQIAAANDIADLVGSYFPLRRAGSNFKALCPFHQEKTPSFMVSPSRQTFHCFGCRAGGSVFRFVMDYEHVDFPDAVRKLGARVGITVVETRGAGEQDRQHEARRTLLKALQSQRYDALIDHFDETLTTLEASSRRPPKAGRSACGGRARARPQARQRHIPQVRQGAVCARARRRPGTPKTARKLGEQTLSSPKLRALARFTYFPSATTWASDRPRAPYRMKKAREIFELLRRLLKGKSIWAAQIEAGADRREQCDRV
jgi:hypothetical protein